MILTESRKVLTMATKASDKRFNAIAEFTETYRPQSNGYLLLAGSKAEDMIADIEAMRKLGRTERWQNALTGWIKMINEYPNDLEWAVLQGGIYAGHETE
jgi:hypothetical protein